MPVLIDNEVSPMPHHPHFRFATEADLPAMLSLLVDDILGSTRESLDQTDRRKYEQAFRAIAAQEGNDILIGEDETGVIAMLQITIIPGLNLGGASRANIEGLRVKSQLRGKGIVKLLMERAIVIARDAGCSIVQLTTNQQRSDAIRFYETLGFTPSHIGMKLSI